MVVRLPPLHALRTFEAVARLGSITAAAEDLCISTSAVSHQISKLEDWLETALLEKHGRGVRLTPLGETYARTVCDCFGRMSRETAQIRGGGKEAVRVSCLPMISVSWLIPNLHDFWTRHPDVAVSIDYARAGETPQDGRFDFAIRFGATHGWEGYQVTPLLAGHGAVVCSPAYRMAHGIEEPADLARCELLHDEDREFWRRWLVKAGLDARPAETGTVFPDGNLTLANVVAGDGVGLLRLATIQDQLRSKTLMRLFDLTIDEDLHYILLQASGRPLRGSARLFRDWLIALAQKNPMVSG